MIPTVSVIYQMLSVIAFSLSYYTKFSACQAA